MFKSKVLVGIVLICYILFAIFEFSGNHPIAYYFHALIAPIITIFYILFANQKSKLLLLFLLCYSLSDIIVIVIDSLPFEKSEIIYTFDYYIGNALYVFGYIFLIIKIFKYINFMHVIRNFKMHLIVLCILNVYLLYVLQAIIGPNLISENDYFLELAYNIVLFLLLSVGLLNYIYNDSKKALYLFLGTLCIVFSEVIEIAYIYVAQRRFLDFVSTTLVLIAFYFFYKQSKLLNINNEEGDYIIAE